ncbi:lipoprotein [Pectobacterium brasiliense]|uniref:Lipoprotein n=1 Tax=Pectobacterium brasiliense TaxID=180957 RepID=A0A0M2F4E5_9GAMM|nr:lipoprotein [Pectobacterium brasiliense]KGA35012.1 lipoprotein [Pectobacterium brasiliense]
MRCVSLLLPVLLVACSQQPTEDLAAALAADPARLKALRAQCTADRMMAGEDACLAAADAFRRRFFAGETGPDEFRTLADLPPIPPSFDTPASDQDAMPFEGDMP